MGKRKRRKKVNVKPTAANPVATIQEQLKNYFESNIFSDSVRGASSAWEGFQRQTIYICSRIAEGVKANYLPETVEDLAVIFPDESLELVQVKSISSDFTLSVLKPNKEDSFFRHIIHFYKLGIRVIPKIVVFGKLGAEMANFVSGDVSSKNAIAKKLSNYFPDQADFVSYLLETLIVEECEEDALKDCIYRNLGDFFEASVAPDMVFRELTTKVEECSRSRGSIDGDWLISASRQIAQKAAALRGCANQYGITIRPLSNIVSESLGSEDQLNYRLGVSARLSHIINGFDVARPRLFMAIEQAFTRSRIVLVRGASGQGKSTACYRYLYDKGLFWSFSISSAMDEKDANEIAACLRGLSEETEKPVYAYIDGATGRGWFRLANEINKSVPNVRLLVSIREEDLNDSLTAEWDLSCSYVYAKLDKDEAREIFEYFKTETVFPSFEESWRSFGGKGPLMEYIFSITQGVSLKRMLRSQVTAIAAHADDKELTCLYIASVLGSEGVPTSVRALKAAVECSGLYCFLLTIRDEHLIRLLDNGLLMPLHPYRSMVLAKELETIIATPLDIELFSYIVRCGEGPIGRVLASHFGVIPLNQRDADDIADSISSWTAASEVLKYALWADTRTLFEKSEELRLRSRKEEILSSFAFMMGGGLVPREKKIDRAVILSIIKDPSRRSVLETLFTDFSTLRFTPNLVAKLLTAMSEIQLSDPFTDEEYRCAGFAYGISGLFFGVGEKVPKLNRPDQLNFNKTCTLDALLDYSLGLQLAGCSLPSELSAALQHRINSELRIIWSKVENNTLRLFQVGLIGESDVNDSLVSALAAYRELYPSLESYSGRMLGTDLFLPDGLESPDANKSIPAENLPFNWQNTPNFLYRAMCEYDDAPETWTSLRTNLEEFWGLFTSSITGLMRSVERWNNKGCFLCLDTKLVDSLIRVNEIGKEIQLGIPKESLDSKGYAVYEAAIDIRQREIISSPVIAAGGGKASSPFRKTSKAVNAVTSFVLNAFAVLQEIKNGSLTNENQDIRLSMVNLASVYEEIDDIRVEYSDVFGPSKLLSHAKNQILLFWLLWSELCFTPLARKPMLAAARSRLTVLQAAPGRVFDYIGNRDDADVVSGAEGARFKVFVSEDTPSFEEMFDCALAKIYPSLNYDLLMPEASVLPLMLGPVRVDYYIGSSYFYSEVYPSSQLIYVGERGHKPLCLPEGPDGLIPDAARAPHFEIYKLLQGLRTSLGYYQDVMHAITDEDPDMRFVDYDSFLDWKNDLVVDCRENLRSVKEWLSKLEGQAIEETVVLLDKIDSELGNDNLEDSVEDIYQEIDDVLAVIQVPD